MHVGITVYFALSVYKGITRTFVNVIFKGYILYSLRRMFLFRFVVDCAFVVGHSLYKYESQ